MLSKEIKDEIITAIKESELEYEVSACSIRVKRDDGKTDEINKLYALVDSYGNCGWTAVGHRKYTPAGKHSSAVSGTHTAYQIS